MGKDKYVAGGGNVDGKTNVEAYPDDVAHNAELRENLSRESNYQKVGLLVNEGKIKQVHKNMSKITYFKN